MPDFGGRECVAMFIRIEASSGVPIWRQIADQIRAQCATRALGAGDRLPSVRALARELAVNQNTILRVYERLTLEGLLERRHGSGTFVAAAVPAARLEGHQLDLLAEQADRLVRKAAMLAVDAPAVRRLVDQALQRAAAASPGAQGEEGKADE